MHARVVPTGVLTTEEITKHIAHRSTATTGDVALVLTMLVDEMKKGLTNGYRVQVEGLGIFELTLKNRPVRTPTEIRSESIRVKSVVFRPAAELKHSFRGLKPKRVEDKYHSPAYTEEAIEKRLKRYFEQNADMQSADFRSLFGFTSSTSTRRLRSLVAAGKLIKTGHVRSPLYKPGEALQPNPPVKKV
jgi:predicted histone-like DNA-binding protein